jgi:hypothetical protein
MIDEYPKMLTFRRADGRVLPMMRDNKPVVFTNADEERAFASSTCTPHSGEPEMHSHRSYRYRYDAWDPWDPWA